MSIIIILIICGVVLTIGLWFVAMKLADYNYDGFAIALGVINTILDTCIIVGIIMIPIWFTAKYSVEVINKKYHTEYTADEYFWAGDTIDKIIKTDENLLDQNNKLNLTIENK